MLCHPEPGSAVSYALRNAKSPFTFFGSTPKNLNPPFRKTRPYSYLLYDSGRREVCPKCDVTLVPSRTLDET